MPHDCATNSPVASEHPAEILDIIFSHLVIPLSQPTLHAAALVSRTWYSSAIRYLYCSPVITGKNFDLFVTSICPSVNARVRSNGLASLLRKLDMSGLVYNGSKHLTARLIGRTKQNLEEFIAPQATFGVNSLAAISHCKHLRCLDLGFVSETIPMSDLLRSIRRLDKLVLLCLPRAASYRSPNKLPANLCTEWPLRLKKLHVNGAFFDHNMRFLMTLPPSVSDVWLERFPPSFLIHVEPFFSKLGPQLEALHIRNSRGKPGDFNIMPAISDNCTSLRNLSVNIELVGDSWGLNPDPESFYPFPSVERLEIGCLEEFADDTLDWWLINLSNYIFSEKLPELRCLLIHQNLRCWDNSIRRQRVKEMDDLLKVLAREDGESARTPEDKAGVIVFGENYW